jgi:hypothetical protein
LLGAFYSQKILSETTLKLLFLRECLQITLCI